MKSGLKENFFLDREMKRKIMNKDKIKIDNKNKNKRFNDLNSKIRGCRVTLYNLFVVSSLRTKY